MIDLVIFLGTVYGMYCLIQKKWYAFLVFVPLNILGGVLAFRAGLWGMAVSCLIFMGFNLYGARKWWKDDRRSS